MPSRTTTAGCRLGCAPYLGLQKLLAFLGALYARAPYIDVEVFHLPSSEQRRLLQCAELDMALLDDADADADIESQPLFPGDPLVAFVPAGDALALRLRLDPRALTGRRLLIRPQAMDTKLDDLLMSWAAHGGTGAEVRDRGGHDPRDLLFAVADGHGIAIGPLSLSAAAGDVGSLVTARPLDPPLTTPDTRLACRADPPAHLRDTLAHARDIATRLRHEAMGPRAGTGDPGDRRSQAIQAVQRVSATLQRTAEVLDNSAAFAELHAEREREAGRAGAAEHELLRAEKARAAARRARAHAFARTSRGQSRR
jgi:DNA-binding transcriptional LysR family regulator